MFSRVLFFPITPYDGNGEVDLDELAAHIERGESAGTGGLSGERPSIALYSAS